MLILQENSKGAVPNAFCGVGALTKKVGWATSPEQKKETFFVLPTCSLPESPYAQYLIKTPVQDEQELLGREKKKLKMSSLQR